MIIYQDTREQLPLKFKLDKGDELVVKTLPFGDYWASPTKESNEFPVMFERKGLGDLFGTMTAGYDRFKREMERAKQMECHLILVIEGSLRRVHEGYEHSQFDGASMLKKLATLHVKYDLEYHFCNDREEMARLIYETFSAIDRLWSKDGRPNKQA